MGKEFQRLKRYNATWRMIRSIAVAIALTLLLIGGIMVLTKLRVLEGGVVHYAISAAIGVAVSVAYWLMQRRSDMRIAEKIDEEHRLRERVQTMVEYRNSNTAMLQVQREDTEARLQAVRSFGQKKLTLAAHFAMILVAFAVFATGVMLPVQAVPQPTKPTEPPFEASQWQKAALEELIAHVQDSDMTEVAKEPVVAKLWELRDALDTKLTAKIVQAQVLETIRFTYATGDNVNSNDDIHDIIERYVVHDQAEELAYALGAIGNKDREGDIATIGTELAKEDNLPTLSALADMLDKALSNSAFDENDALYAALANATAILHQAGDAVDAGDAVNAVSLLGTAISELKNDANNALTQQDLTKEECVYVVDQLCEIFAIPDNLRPGDPDENFLQTSDKEYNETGGGAGSGTPWYPGSDYIYDHEIDDYRLYSEMLTERFYPLMRQKLKDGTLSQEILEYIKDYYNEIQTGANVGTKDEE